MPEDAELLRLMKADAANRRTWEALRARGAARRAGRGAVNSEAANLVLEEFQCIIMGTGDVSDETVTTPCGHNFDRESLRHYLRGRVEDGHEPTCVTCSAKLLPPAEWAGSDLKDKVNAALVAAVKAITGQA